MHSTPHAACLILPKALELQLDFPKLKCTVPVLKPQAQVRGHSHPPPGRDDAPHAKCMASPSQLDPRVGTVTTLAILFSFVLSFLFSVLSTWPYYLFHQFGSYTTPPLLLKIHMLPVWSHGFSPLLPLLCSDTWVPSLRPTVILQSGFIQSTARPDLSLRKLTVASNTTSSSPALLLICVCSLAGDCTIHPSAPQTERLEAVRPGEQG